MAKSENQKIKLLKLYDLLRLETDNNHTLSTNEIIESLREEGIRCNRKTLASDIDVLNQCEFPDESEHGGGIQIVRGRQNKYYLATRDLDMQTIRFLIDATQSAAFLTKEETQKIVSGLSMLAGSYKAELLKHNILYFNKLKHAENVLDMIEKLDAAIEEKKQVSFEYHVFGVNGKAEPKRDQNGHIKRYCVSPVAMTFKDGYYYLIAYQPAYDDIAPYRTDRMRAVETEKADCVPNQYEAKFKNGELKNSMNAFGMWSGETKRVTMRLLNRHAGDILDKFGEGTKLYPVGKEEFIVTVEVNPADPVFLGWCMSYGNELEILFPTEAREALLHRAEEIVSMYSHSTK